MDNNVGSRTVKASDCKCIECGKPAVAFWPCIDMDIPKHPYCATCLARQQIMALKEIEAFKKQ